MGIAIDFLLPADSVLYPQSSGPDMVCMSPQDGPYPIRIVTRGTCHKGKVFLFGYEILTQREVLCPRNMGIINTIPGG